MGINIDKAQLSYRNVLKWLQSITPVKFFVLISSIFGLLFIIITPPFQTPDEPVHFYRAYQISTFNFVPDYIDGVLWGGKLPKSIDETVVEVNTPQINFRSEQRYDLRKTFNAFSIRTVNNQYEYYQTSSAIFTPIMYIPQTSAILVGRLINAPPILMMYLARLAMLTFWIVIFSQAIRLMPKKKWALAYIGLLPMTLFQAISLGGDALIIGFGAIYFAYILKLRDQKEFLTSRQLIILITMATIMVLGKAIMIALVPLSLLLIVKQKNKSKVKLLDYRVLLTLIIPALFYIAWLYVIRDVDTHPAQILPNGADASKQIQNILNNPSSILLAFWNMYILSWGDHISRSTIGSFGWMDTPLPESTTVIGYIGLILLILASTNKAKRKWLNNREKIFIAFLFFAYWILVNIAMYISNTTVGIHLIYGLQGRYFLPLIIFCIPLMRSYWLIMEEKAYNFVAKSVPLFLLSSSIITILFRYYIDSI